MISWIINLITHLKGIGYNLFNKFHEGQRFREFLSVPLCKIHFKPNFKKKKILEVGNVNACKVSDGSSLSFVQQLEAFE